MDFPSSKRPATASAESVQFRLLCPASRTGAIIGKGGSVIRHLQSLTGSKIRVIDDIPVPSEERVVLITAPNATKKDDSSNACDPENPNSDQTKPPETAAADKPGEEAPPPPSSSALVRVLERIVFGDDAANGDGSELDKGEFEGLCRVLVRGNQVDYLMSQGGMMMQRIRDESGASVRIASTDQIPPCAFPGDVVIQVMITCNS